MWPKICKKSVFLIILYLLLPYGGTISTIFQLHLKLIKYQEEWPFEMIFEKHRGPSSNNIHVRRITLFFFQICPIFDTGWVTEGPPLFGKVLPLDWLATSTNKESLKMESLDCKHSKSEMQRFLLMWMRDRRTDTWTDLYQSIISWNYFTIGRNMYHNNLNSCGEKCYFWF